MERRPCRSLVALECVPLSVDWGSATPPSRPSKAPTHFVRVWQHPWWANAEAQTVPYLALSSVACTRISLVLSTCLWRKQIHEKFFKSISLFLCLFDNNLLSFYYVWDTIMWLHQNGWCMDPVSRQAESSSGPPSRNGECPGCFQYGKSWMWEQVQYVWGRKISNDKNSSQMEWFALKNGKLCQSDRVCGWCPWHSSAQRGVW